jgi:hypothetical protein
MSLITIEVAIDHGRIVPREPMALPEHGSGLLTILESVAEDASVRVGQRQRIQLPLIQGKPGEIVNPTREELDASFWG